MLQDPTYVREIDGSSVLVSDLVGRGDAAGETVNAVRMTMIDAQGAVTYLGIDIAGDGQAFYPATWLPGFDDWTGDETWAAGPALADISQYGATAGDATLSFMLELGNYKSDGSWIVLAVSEMANLGQLRNDGFILADAKDMHGRLPWTTSFSVPEPTSGLLILIGGAILSLRRKRRF